ncbi:MAG TPA: cupin domain-containing protein [Myxococcota bacterium]|jgi:uncharacterized cupin superfamily protein|nr:cupin domain-containing protein [Myxococcota bacterium]
MSEERRHPQLVNVAEVEGFSRSKGTRFGFAAKFLGRATGAQGIGCTWYEVPPGRTAFPRHYHCVNEEALFVLEGEGSLRLGERTLPVRAGDYMTFPTGPELAHQLANTGGGPLRYLCFSTLRGAEVVGYPDSNKIGAMAGPDPTGRADLWVRAIFPAAAQVDYYEGEQVE